MCLYGTLAHNLSSLLVAQQVKRHSIVAAQRKHEIRKTKSEQIRRRF